MVNKVILVGNVGMDPEVRSLEGGVKTARIRLATTERIFNRQTQESREHTEWHTVILWRGLADVADRFIRKGSQIYVEGRLRTREWEDQNGAKRISTEIVADELKLLGRRHEGGAPAGEGGYPGGQSGYQGSQGGYQSSQPAPQSNYQAPAAPAAEPPVNDPDDLPF